MQEVRKKKQKIIIFEECLSSGGLEDFMGECTRVRRSGGLHGPYFRREKLNNKIMIFEECLSSGGLEDFMGECTRVRRSGGLRGPYFRREKLETIQS